MTINTANLQLLSLLIQHLLNAYLLLFLPLGLITGCMCLCAECECVSEYYPVCPDNLSLNLFPYSYKYKGDSCHSYEWITKLDSSRPCLLRTIFSSDHYFPNMLS